MRALPEPPIVDAAPHAVSPVHVELLDAPCLHGADGKRLPLERKAAALLAMLALDGARPRADLAALLWPEVTLAQARNSLRQRLFRLQRAGGRDIVIAANEVRLADGVTNDLADAAERLAADPQARAGELLGNLDYGDCLALADWVEMARARWREQRRSLLAQLASQHEARGEIAPALRYAERLVGDEPLLEHTHRRLMRLHYLRGDRSAALAAYERCREVLRSELHATPDRETSELARLIASGSALAPRPLAPPVSVLRPPRLIGRDAERLRLDAALSTQRVLLVSGEPGIGKTRLIEDALEAHPQVLACGAQAGESGLPYALLARLARRAHERYAVPLDGWVTQELARLAPEFGPGPSGRLDPLRLQQAVAAALDAWSQAGLGGVAVDDLHHADEASLESLLALAASVRMRRLAWLFGVRSQEMPVLLVAWLGAAGELGVETLRLDALDVGAIEALLASLALPQFDPALWSAPLVAHSGGNPLFALETLRALIALGDAAPSPLGVQLPVPAGLGALIERRLARLSEAALRLARVAALAGSDFDADVAALVLEVHPLDIVDAWRELEQTQMLRLGRFTHDSIGEAVLRALPLPIAQALHGRLAERLDTLGKAAARIAPHWARAGAWSRAGDAYATAARDAQRASRRADEVALWEQAAECYDCAGMAGKAFDARGDSIESVIFVRGVQVAMQLAERLAADEQTEPQRMRALTAQANVSLMAGDHLAGEAAARAALEAATRLDALWPRFEAARLLAVALAQAARAGEALQVIEPFRDTVERSGSAEQRLHFWSDYAYVLKAALRLRDTAEALRRAMQCAQAAGDHAELATLTSNLATVEGNFGHVEQALDHAKRARLLRDPLGDAGGPASGAIDLYVAIYSGAVGRYGDALDNLDRADACFAGNGQTMWSALASNHRANLLLQLGQYARARKALEHAPVSMISIQGRTALLVARLERALGRSGDDALRRSLELLGPQADPYNRMLAQLDATLAMAPAEALAACAAVLAEAEALEHDGIAARARLHRLEHLIRAAALQGEQPAIDALASLLGVVQPADIYPPEAWWTLYRAHVALGDEPAADAALATAYAWAVQRALPQVPPAFRDSFLHRNATNRDLIAAAGRRLGLHVAAV